MSGPEAISDFRYHLTRLSRRLRQISRNDPQSWSRMLVLSAISRMGNDVTPSELAVTEDTHSSNLAPILKHLEEKGAIERHTDPCDRRKVRIRLTQKGMAELDLSRKRRDEWLYEAIKNVLSEEETEMLLRTTSLLGRLADRP
jgi:DNA-binding MarR family transcriptional regulator